MTIFSCSPPPSVNRMYIKGRIKSEAYRAWLSEAGWQLKAQNVRPVPGPVSLNISCPENGRRDLGNHEKPMTDLLVRMGLIEDDRNRIVRKITLEWTDQPSMLIRIESVPNGQPISKPSRPRPRARSAGGASGSRTSLRNS